jgi:hypothetical protein
MHTQIMVDPSGKWPVIGPFYNSCMNMDLRDKLDYTILEELLSELDVPIGHTHHLSLVLKLTTLHIHAQGISLVKDLMVTVGVLHNVGMPVLISIG